MVNEQRDGKIENRKSGAPFGRLGNSRPWLLALLVVLLTLPAAWPFLARAGFWESHDGLFHLYRLFSLEEAWQQGHPYPRTFPDFAFGYGFAVLHFYGPLTYFIALALKGLGLGAVGAMKATYALSYPLAALSVWWLARDLWRRAGEPPNERAGLVAAAAYTYVPYHLADVQLRGALAESWAFVWWPLLFWAVWRGRRWALAFALAALILTHNLSVVLVAMPLAVWAGLRYFRFGWRAFGNRVMVMATDEDLSHRGTESTETADSTPHGLRATLLGGLLGLALSAFYWLPVVLEAGDVGIAQDVGGLGFARHLQPLGAWLARGPSYRYFPEQGVAGEHPLSWAQVALLAAALVGGVRGARGPQRGMWLFWWLLLAGALFLVTPTSAPLWRTLVFPFGLIQYPWRWMGLVALATALVVSAPLAWQKQAGTRQEQETTFPFSSFFSPLSFLFCVLLLWLAFSSLQHLPWQPVAVDRAQHPAAMWAADAARGQVGATWTAEFLPLTVREQRWALARAPERVAGVGATTPLRVTAAGGDGWTLWAEVEAGAGGWLGFPRFALPSMRVTVNGRAAGVELRGLMGLAGVEVPPGHHRVELATSPLAARPALGWGTALLALAVVVGGLWRVGARLGPRARWGLLVLPLVVLVPLVVRAPDRVAPPLGAGQPITLGEQAQLAAVRLPWGPARAGGTLPVRLLWFNLRATDRAYTTFLHLTALGGGAPLAQHDAQPNMDTVPTPRWLPGQLVEDLHLLTLPHDLPPGQYELWGGMYAPENGTAAPVPGDSGERRLLARVEIKE